MTNALNETIFNLQRHGKNNNRKVEIKLQNQKLELFFISTRMDKWKSRIIKIRKKVGVFYFIFHSALLWISYAIGNMLLALLQPTPLLHSCALSMVQQRSKSQSNIYSDEVMYLTMKW